MCERVVIPGVGSAIVCRGRGTHKRAKWCSKCGTRKATKLCDGLLEGPPPNRTCDKALCEWCAHVRGQGDFCDDCVDRRRPKLAL